MISEVVTTESIRWLELVINIQETAFFLLLVSILLAVLGEHKEDKEQLFSDGMEDLIVLLMAVAFIVFVIATLFRIWL